ncbi:2-hydroxyacid dehydrogenase [Ornithinimicrobium faecis]|uniref:2-hydroxyacid dehydrogenase n=1 Tax=Ornithinimicrobium faecis TaxID=2934158 RepID=A0ABY4YRA1_9MICO|nr:2-hydroxyacid dehydrogenase [Ornithinimicrobium sp. HY1793]USQ79286.1 2-hydroxyacid dehydrogenase [Ornithinimicrobium sp. HY1793]
MPVISVPPVIASLVEPVEGVEIVTWDVASEPPRDDIEVVVVPPFNSPFITRLGELPKLRAVILSTAGYEHAVRFLPPGVSMANAVGVHDTATAEMALTLLLAAQRDLPTFVRAQDEGRWVELQERRALADQRVLVVGYGGIGRALAARLLACETSVTAVASRARDGDEFVDSVHSVSDLPALLAEHDMVVLAVPLSEATRGMIGAAELALLPDNALVVNVGRGPLVDTEALIAECASGRLRAALDVTDPEPLPEDHPLWRTPGVLISPHVAGGTSVFPSRQARYVQTQIEHYLSTGELKHVVATGEEQA